MTRALAYCAFLHRSGMSLPNSGVNGAAIEQITQGELRLLWSQVEWPFDSSSIQRFAVEFHSVVTQIFNQTAVVPFRLLSIFDDRQALLDFVTTHHAAFISDLHRLQDMVQMECVLYFVPAAGSRLSGKEYLERKAELQRSAREFVGNLERALAGLFHGIRRRESRTGERIFVLMHRDHAGKFRSVIHDLPVPGTLTRRTSGPWPAAEFLSDAVRAPHTVGSK